MERAMDNDEILNEIQRLVGFYPKLAEEILVCAITLHFTAPPSDKWLVLEQEIRRRLSQTYLEHR